MSFIPYYFGPGALIKVLFPRYFSMTAFIIVQMIIDAETVYHTLRHEYPVHQFLHTYLGSGLAVIGTVLVYRPLHNFFLGEITWWNAVFSSLLGAVSHVFIDSIMYYSIKPLTPFRYGNPHWQLIDAADVHLLCVYAAIGAAGILILKEIVSKISARMKK